MINRYFVLLVTCLLLFSCAKSDKKVPVYSDVTSEQIEETDTEIADEYASGEVVTVPFTERGGVKYIPVRINGMKVDMIFDTGCSDALISIAEARYLAEKGYLTQEDFIVIKEAK